jgi:hypothetical protein
MKNIENNEDSQKKHNDEELQRYNKVKRKSNLKFYALLILIVILGIAWIIISILR